MTEYHEMVILQTYCALTVQIPGKTHHREGPCQAAERLLVSIAASQAPIPQILGDCSLHPLVSLNTETYYWD